MSMDKDLGALICMLNPYTYGQQNAMDPHVFVPADYSGPALPPAAGGAATTTAASPSGTSPAASGGAAATTTAPSSGTSPAALPDMTGVWIEIDKQHPHWDFKEQPHRIAKAVRIAYRWPYTVDGLTVWITDYVLVGFEGANGG